jgi:3-hydroxyacyl-CoA dehydrogenase
MTAAGVEQLLFERRVLIVGAGSIGASIAIVFARAGWAVQIFDASPDARSSAVALAESKLAATGAGAAGPVIELITVADSLDGGAVGADLVFECASESLAVKRVLFSQLEAVCASDAVFASVSSTIPISESAGHLASRARALVVHPVNPPHLIPVVELVPAPFTAPSTLERAEAMLVDVAMSPVVLRAEIEGFVINRLQAAILREAMYLVGEGVMDPAEIDLVVRDGLAPRWTLGGPFETADINSRGGFAAHAETIGRAYSRFGAEREGRDAWSQSTVETVVEYRRRMLPLERWTDASLDRERRLATVIRGLEELAQAERNDLHA